MHFFYVQWQLRASPQCEGPLYVLRRRQGDDAPILLLPESVWDRLHDFDFGPYREQATDSLRLIQLTRNEAA